MNPPSSAKTLQVHDETCGALMRGVDRKDLSDSVLSWQTWDIPEFQDQQRFVGSAAPTEEYGPLACAVAAPNLGLLDDAAFDGSGGVLAGIIWVRFDRQPINRSYTRLHIDDIRHPFYCVVIRHNVAPSATPLANIRVPELNARRATPPGSWEGYIVPAHDKMCESIDGKRPLIGSRMTSEQMTTDLIPGVARFMIDKGWRAGVGIRCGIGWCTLGFAESDNAPPAHGYGPSGDAKSVSRRAVPGWFDDQEVALPTASTLGIRPRLPASIVPDTALGRYTLSDFDAGWKPVATVHFRTPPSGKYSSKWRFVEGGNVGNLMELTRIDSAGVRVWRVRINGVENKLLKVTQTPHPTGMRVIGTARWAWSDTDELIWVRCDDGCCKVEPI